MDNTYKNFYRNYYLRTGFIASKPLRSLFPGDFFQVNQGEIIVLGNIFRNNVVDPKEAAFEYGIRLNQANWNFADGVSKPYSGRGSGQSPVEGNFEFSKQVLSFASKGSFVFRGNNPEAVKLTNWNEIENQLIIQLTQTLYSFRELYLVTEIATTSDWTLAISGAGNAELEIATDAENFGLVDIFGHNSTKTIQSRDIEYYHRETGRTPTFFKAKKLTVQNEKLDVFMNELIQQSQDSHEWASNFYEYDFQHKTSYVPHIQGNSHVLMLDMLQGDSLNPNTALQYFKWTDANLDDIEKLFVTYGQ